MAWFSNGQVEAFDSERSVHNGSVENGEAGPGGLVNLYNFCPSCGSTVFWTFENVPEGFPEPLRSQLPDRFMIPVGTFADADFPAPNQHLFPELRPHWLHAHEAYA